MRSQTTLLACAALVLAAAMLPSAHASEPQAVRGQRVVLLHGLARSASSMSRMAKALERAGFDVCNVSYPSRKHAIEELAVDFVGPAVLACFPKDDRPVHFVTHSLGGVIVRQLAASGVDIHFGRIVRLSPPSEGSEVVDKVADWWMFRKLNGPAGSELGTGVDSVPLRLGATSLDVGVITGDRSVNWILSTFIPGQDDGKVSVSRARLNGMHDFLVVHSSHPFIMRNAVAIDQTMCYLEHGQFDRK